MADSPEDRALVLGVGNPDRGDDGAGRSVARALRLIAPAGVEIEETDGDATRLLERIEGRSRVLIVDACVAGGAAGRVHRFDAARAPLPSAALRVSSHGLGLNHAIEIARALGSLPPQCRVYAIEGLSFERGAPLSPAVAAAAARLAEELARELREAQHA